MSVNRKELIVVDNEYRLLANQVLNYGNELYQRMMYYSGAIDYITNNAIKDKAVSERLRFLRQNIDKLRIAVSDECKSINMKIESYVNEIDDADSYLY